MIKMIIHGCNGKMGQVVASIVSSDPDIQIVAGIDKFIDLHENPFPVFSSLEECDIPCDVILDFSRHDAVYPLLEYASDKKLPVVVATTGLAPEDITFIEQKTAAIPIFLSANMSIGINLMHELLQKAASTLGNDFDIEIVEKHHNQKIDAPSGTAYALADTINKALQNSKHYVYGRHGKNEKRSIDEIGIHAIRGGTIAGEHSVLFAGIDEVLEIAHTAHTKQIFAVGALKAAKFLVGKNPGLYNMKDIIAECAQVTNIYTNNDIAMITVNNIPNAPQIIADIFKALGEYNINIDMISQTAPVNGQINISFTLPDKDLSNAIQAIGKFHNPVPSLRTDVFGHITKITVEGTGMERESGVAGKVFGAMAENDIKIKIITTSETTISYIVDQIDEQKAIMAVKEAFSL